MRKFLAGEALRESIGFRGVRRSRGHCPSLMWQVVFLGAAFAVFEVQPEYVVPGLLPESPGRPIWPSCKGPRNTRVSVDALRSLYLDPPAKAVVLCVDEKAGIQALDRSAPMLPGVPERQSFDYIRHGTTSLFAALEIATGQVISAVKRRHRHQEFLAFLAHHRQERPSRLATAATQR